MTQLRIISLLFLIFVGCKEKGKPLNIADQFRGKTYDMIVAFEKDTLTIEFKDSTFSVFEYSDYNLPWRISTYENNDFLVFDKKRVIAIKPDKNGSFEGLLIAKKDYKIKFQERTIQQDKSLLNGIWIEEKYLDYVVNDSIPKLPPPPPPPGIEEGDFQWPPFYEINGNKIISKYRSQASQSNIETSNSGEFVIMDLPSYKAVEKLWKIKTLNDSVMILNRTIKKEDTYSSFSEKVEEDIKLVKKR